MIKIKKYEKRLIDQEGTEGTYIWQAEITLKSEMISESSIGSIEINNHHNKTYSFGIFIEDWDDDEIIYKHPYKTLAECKLAAREALKDLFSLHGN